MGREPVSNESSDRGTLCVAEEPPAGRWRASFCIGEVSLDLAGDGIPPVFGRQLEPFRSDSTARGIEIRLQWVESLSPPPGQQFFDSGSVWTLYQDGAGLLFDFASSVVGPEPYKRLHIDREFRQGLLMLNRSCFRDPSTCNPLEYPLDELMVMHRLGRERGVEVHAAGMRATDGNGYLFLGHSGAGKSTTTRLWYEQHRVTVLSDDRIILREQAGEVWMHGTPWHGEAAFAAPEKARIQRLFILEHAPENKITPLSGSRAVGEVMARSFLPFYDAAALSNTMGFLQEIVATIPCYRLQFRPDSTAVEAVRQFQALN
jgi:hypothetical protein